MEPLPLLGELQPDTLHIVHPELWSPRGQYLALDKGFGAVDPHTLEHFADQLEKAGQPEDLGCAASAIIEATIFDPDRSAETLDYNLFRIDYANTLMQDALAGHYNKLERGALDPDDLHDLFHAEVNAAFGGIYKNIIAGEINPGARDEAFAKLSSIGRDALAHTRGTRTDFSNDAVGAAFEIVVLLAGLTEDSGMITVPSTPRGGNGSHSPEKTHDFNYLKIDEAGELVVNVPIELKSVRSIKRVLDAGNRYDKDHVVLVHTHHDLGLRFKDLPNIFGQKTLNQSARRQLLPVRQNLYSKVLGTLEGWQQAA